MNTEERRGFCERAIAELEGCIMTAQSAIGKQSAPEQDKDAAAAVMALVEARAVLLAEAAAYELEDEA